MNRDTLDTDIPRWYEWGLAADGFVLRLPPSTVAFVNDTLASAHIPDFLEDFGMPFTAPLPPSGPWGAHQTAATRLDADGWTACHFPKRTYDRPERAGAVSLHVLTRLLDLYDGPGIDGKNQLLTLDGVGYQHDYSGGGLEATFSPALARWCAQGDVRERLSQIEQAMRANSLYGSRGRFVQAFLTSSGKLVMENGASISIGPRDPNPSELGYTLVPNNMDAPVVHYAYLCGLARLYLLARAAGL